MSGYKHILLATDFSAHDDVVAERAKELQSLYQAKLSLVHVTENMPISSGILDGGSIPYDIELGEELMDLAKERLAKYAQSLGIADDDQWLVIGSPKLEIVNLAKEQAVDLIILGSHGRHGLALLLGSTANGVLHYAPCDVLAVRLQDD